MYIVRSAMGFNKNNRPSTPKIYASSTWLSKRKLLILCLLFIISFPLLLFNNSIFPRSQLIDLIHLQQEIPSSPDPFTSSIPEPFTSSSIIPDPFTSSSIIPDPFPYSSNKAKPPRWLKAIREAHLTHRRPLKVGLINFDSFEQSRLPVGGIAEYITIELESLSPDVTWKKLFPEWIDEKPSDKCPTIPMPGPGKYLGLDVVLAKLPCREENFNKFNGSQMKEGIRDAQRLQISLATARLIVENGIDKSSEDVYGVFDSKCEPMVEIFRCDDLVWHGGSKWVYKPKLDRLREMVSMPVGACELPRPYNGDQDNQQFQQNPTLLPFLRTTRSPRTIQRREAYVTILHSSEIYVCGAIALAQSILQTNTTKDLILLADRTISDHSITGLQAAGWKVKRIKRIRSPNAKVNAYNEWNYSKLRVWQLTEYDKVMFIDSDFIVLHNIDHFFNYPQISAGSNDKWLFNSGIMILEPSECFFKYLLSKRYSIKSYNGGDQGYLNEILTWWHRLTRKINFMKFYFEHNVARERVVPDDRFTIHYLGFKPWLCYRDYDCNWDKKDHQKYASDDVHGRWWKVFDEMPKELQLYCGLSKKLDESLQIRRSKAQKANLFDGHWKIKINDPRQFVYNTVDDGYIS